MCLCVYFACLIVCVFVRVCMCLYALARPCIVHSCLCVKVFVCVIVCTCVWVCPFDWLVGCSGGWCDCLCGVIAIVVVIVVLV